MWKHHTKLERHSLPLVIAILIVVFTLIADILYGILDPRIRYY